MNHPTVLNAKVKPVYELNTDLPVSVTFKGNTYRKHSISPFIPFIVFLVNDDWFTLDIDGQKFEVHISFDGYMGFTATTNNYDGPEDNLNIYHSFNSRADALVGLVEQLSVQFTNP